MPRKLNLHAVRQKFKETHPNIHETIDFTIDDGPDATIYHIEHPLFQSNATKRALDKARQAQNDLDMAQALLGDQWDRFEQEGGQASDVMLMLAEIQDDLTDTLPDGTPTRR